MTRTKIIVLGVLLLAFLLIMLWRSSSNNIPTDVIEKVLKLRGDWSTDTHIRAQ